MSMRWEQTCSKGMMMMFMEGGVFHDVAAWRKAGRLWEGPQFRNLSIASGVSPPSSPLVTVPEKCLPSCVAFIFGALCHMHRNRTPTPRRSKRRSRTRSPLRSRSTSPVAVDRRRAFDKVREDEELEKRRGSNMEENHPSNLAKITAIFRG